VNNLEKAVVQAALKWEFHRRFSKSSNQGLTEALSEAAWALNVGCPECNYDRHLCPGCGASIGHGDGACGNCAPAVAGVSASRTDGTDLLEPPRMSELESEIAELVLDIAQEWLRYVHLGDREEQVLCTWHDDEEGLTLHVESETGHGGRFKVNVSAQQLPDEPRWYPMHWRHVVTGDRVRMPGTEHTAEVTMRYRHRSEDPEGLAWHVVPGQGEHWTDHAVQPGECVVVLDSGEPRFMRPDAEVEIEFTPAEYEAVQRLIRLGAVRLKRQTS